MKNISDEITTYIKWTISSGEFKQTEKLPSENALAIKFHCSRLTARKALQNVKKEGLIVSRKGKGYFVSMGKKLVHSPLHGKPGEKEKFHIVNLEPDNIQNTTFINLGFDLKKNLRNFNFNFFKTYYDKNEKPYSLLLSWVNTSLLGQPNPNDIKKSFANFLVKHNILVNKRIERIFIIKSNKTIEVKMSISSKSFVVAVYSIMFNNDKIPIEIAIRYTIPEEYSETFTKQYI